jgi:hypothetical protein
VVERTSKLVLNCNCEPGLTCTPTSRTHTVYT